MSYTTKGKARGERTHTNKRKNQNEKRTVRVKSRKDNRDEDGANLLPPILSRICFLGVKFRADLRENNEKKSNI